MQLCKEAWKKFRTSTGFFFQASLRNCIIAFTATIISSFSFPQFIYDLFHISLTCQILLQKVRLLSTFCKNLICCKTGWNMGGKTRNVVFQLVLPFYRILTPVLFVPAFSTGPPVSFTFTPPSSQFVVVWSQKTIAFGRLDETGIFVWKIFHKG